MKLISSKTEYEVKGKIVTAPNHYGDHHNPKSTTYNFEPGEFIIGIDGRYGNIMVFHFVYNSCNRILLLLLQLIELYELEAVMEDVLFR